MPFLTGAADAEGGTLDSRPDEGEVVVNGGLYWNDLEKFWIDGSRTPGADTGHPEGNSWVAVMLQLKPEGVVGDYSDITVFAVCAAFE